MRKLLIGHVLPVLLLSVLSLGFSLWLLRSLWFDSSTPRLKAATPSNREIGVPVTTPILVTFNKAIKASSVSNSTMFLHDAEGRVVPAAVSYQPESHSATLNPTVALRHSCTYEVTIAGGPSGIQDHSGRIMDTDVRWSFTTGDPARSRPGEGPGGPILVLVRDSSPFSRYYAEILRNEGFNEFSVRDISQVTSAVLKQFDIILLGEFSLDHEEVEMLVNRIRDGGNLIAMRPDKLLAQQIGLRDLGAVLPDGYVSIDTAQPPGKGLINEKIQFHGPADLYQPGQATLLATLSSASAVPSGSPAVILTHFGSGRCAVFTYDLARSIVYTRQGNPSWSGMERDGIPPIRPDDLFYGPAAFDPQRNWVDLSKVAIPQADIQQRLLANLIIYLNSETKPLPRFWYFPNGFKAVVIMTGDDHGHGGTVGRFLSLMAKDPPHCSLDNWDCVRATSNIFPGTVSRQDAAEFAPKGFEIGLHLNANCQDFPFEVIVGPDGKSHKRISWVGADALYNRQLSEFESTYPGLPAPRTSRVDCATWSDYDTQPQLEFKHGIRLDTNYYYWPAAFVGDRPGMFTGSGMPMRFATSDGRLIDVYQAATQMTDESGQSYPFTIDMLLANALGPKEFYGAFTANMHTDYPESTGSDAIIRAAQSRGVPIISARQMLTWLDGRNSSSFQNLSWEGHTLKFTVSVGEGGQGIHTMIPMCSSGRRVREISFNSGSVKTQPVSYQTKTVTGVEYADFASPPGNYQVTYSQTP